ncbi:MAG: double-strand break repair protein AddB [Alphaproteobacteria bacterium]|nr:double-strand break repair protein AddB [Alphaproteobacteria bacterium]
MNIFTIAPGAPFLERLAAGVRASFTQAKDPLALSELRILVPTRRAARSLAFHFAQSAAASSTLLPQILPLGDVDEEALAIADPRDDLALPPAIAPQRRRLLLARLIEAARQGLGPVPIDQALALADSLAGFLDECQTHNADLEALRELVPEGLAGHWQATLDFLHLLKDVWPALLEAESAIDPARRRNLLMEALTARWRETAPAAPIIAAGSTGSIPATATLLKVIARLPNGRVVLPGLDQQLERAAWEALPPTHPQFGLKQLLERMEIAREDVRPWTDDDEHPSPRARLLSEALRPAEASDHWSALVDRARDALAAGFQGLRVAEFVNEQAEATAIAIALRDALETPKATAALITPDRLLARRVVAELRRWEIAADDSGGVSLLATAPGAFLTLLADAVATRFAPNALLAAIRHPLAQAGMPVGQFHRLADQFELAALRGLRPAPGLAGLAARIETIESEGARERATRFLERFGACVAPLADLDPTSTHPIGTLLAAHAAAADALAQDEDGEAAALWSGEAGEAAARLIDDLPGAAPSDLALTLEDYARFIRYLIDAETIRPQRDASPRVFIWGPLEARLQSADFIVLGGLNEGTWPARSDADLWASRPMRETLGLDAPERRIGLAAHDFAQGAAQPRVLLTRSQREEGAPTTPARWLTRLLILADGAGIGAVRDTVLAEFTSLLDDAPRTERPGAPAATPPLAARPREVSVTRIEAWRRDPYRFYAEHILRLRELDPIDAPAGARDRGILLHGILQAYAERFPYPPGETALNDLMVIAARRFEPFLDDPAVRAFWLPRFRTAAEALIARDRAILSDVVSIASEVDGAITVPAPAGPITLRARADRLELHPDGSISILDYKSGKVPTADEVKSFFAPQLPLEGMIAERGGFAAIGARRVRDFIYLSLKGDGKTPLLGEPMDAPPLIALSAERLAARFEAFDNPEQAYHSRPHAQFRRARDAFEHLARVREWVDEGDEEGGAP